MLAVRHSQYGAGHEVAELVDVADAPAPGAGEIRVDLAVAAINPSDLLRFAGAYGKSAAALPADAGSTCTGRIRDVGAGVAGLAVGDCVLLHAHFTGGGLWRERLTVRAADVFPLPAGDPLQLGQLSGNPPSAWQMLTGYVAPEPGGWVMQNAANSAVGHFVIGLARHLHLKCLNVVRRADAVAGLQALGADAVVVDSEALAETVGRITGGARPRLALDAVAGDATRRLASSVADGGIVVNYGLLSGKPCEVEARDTVFRDVSLRGFWLQAWWTKASRAEVAALYRELGGLMAQGSLQAPVEATYPLAQVRAALAHAGRGQRAGKVLLTGAGL